MAKIPGSASTALKILNNYPELEKIIDKSKFKAQVSLKYPSGAELKDEEVSDLYIVLLLSVNSFYQQAGNNAATPQGALINIEECLKSLTLTADDKKNIGNKFCNLGTSSLWDTLMELLLARTMLKNFPSHSIRVDFPLGKKQGKNKPKDADIAILDSNGNPIYFLDAVTPKRAKKPVNSVNDKVVDWIEKKYTSKFSAYCQQNPSAQVAVIVCLIKNEEFYLGFINKLLTNQPVSLHSHNLSTLKGLTLGLACSFRCVDGKNLIIDSIASYP